MTLFRILDRGGAAESAKLRGRARVALSRVGSACAALAVAACSAPDVPPNLVGAGAPSGALTAWVDPFIGTGGHGHVYPGATVPFGMVQLSPDNGVPGWDWTAGYHESDSVLVGFSHTHLSGTGIGDLLDVLVMPVSRRVPVDGTHASRDERPYASPFSHDREEAAPGFYSVWLDRPGVQAELTATERVGLHRYVWGGDGVGAAGAAGAAARPGPAGQVEPGLIVDLGYSMNWDRPVDTGLRVVNDTLLAGFRRSSGWARDQRVFFAMALSRPLVGVDLAAGLEALPPGAARVRSPDSRALLRFDGMSGDTLLVKVGLSYVSEDAALANLMAEAPGWDFDQARLEADRAWERELRKIRVAGGTDAQRRTFHTAFYRTRLCPVLFEDVDGRYRGADGRIHEAEGFRNHSIFSLWDTFRAAHPLFTIVDPDRVPDLVASMLAFGDQHGYLPVWSLVGNETNTMTGHHAVPVLAEAVRKGVAGVDAVTALEAALRSSVADHRGLSHYRSYGYIPSGLEEESVTKTLEYAYDDWAVANLAAAALGQRSLPRERLYEVLNLADDFLDRAGSWRNVLDPRTRFMRGRRADGSWVEPFDPFRSSHMVDTDYTEGNAWQHTWFVPHDVAALMARIGGPRAFAAKLDSLFEADTVVVGENASSDISGMIGQYAHGNEPSHHIAYLYSWAGMPWKTQERVRQILASQYSDGPDGLAGNEDCGQMSAWYVLSAVGFYPVDPVSATYVIGSPLFEEAALDVGEGRTFVVRAPGVSDANLFVQRAWLNGAPLDKAYIRHEDVARGGELVLEMGPEPNRAWASGVEDRPPSQSDEPAPEEPTATLAGAPMSTMAAGGRGSGAATLALQRVPPRPALTVSWLRADPAPAERVRQEFLHAWEGYRAYAWGHDDLRPLSRSFRDWYDASLLMTPVDAFDTMLLMGLDEEAAEAKALILDSLDFDRDFSVQVFEVTIRLLGGLLSAYQMDGDPGFLALATDLGDRLMPAFDSPTGMPYVRVNLRSGETSLPVNNPAEIGTLMLEFGVLSKLTGNPVYYDASKRGIEEVFRRRSPLGLVGTTIDVETGEWVDTDSHVSGRIDSYYEYLLKAWLLFDDEDFHRMWLESMPAVHEHLADEVDGRLWYGRADMNTGERTATRFGALDAFLPALLALGGDLDRATRLQESVYHMWTAYDIEPEQMDYATGEVRSGAYVLRPEAIESAYHLWLLTGEERWRDMGRDMFERIVRWARTDVGYAHVRDIATKELSDGMQSFFLAETLKYAYLLFAPPETLDFDRVIFNTEAHPLRVTWE
ncbi:MAG TPA: GH92 family glycosyl hydrolase [Longimicrobiales bacterium]